MIILPEPGAQAPHRGVRDDRHPRAGRMGGLPPDGQEEAVVLHRGRPGPARPPQAHTTPLPTTTEALQTETRRPRQLSPPPPGPGLSPACRGATTLQR